MSGKDKKHKKGKSAESDESRRPQRGGGFGIPLFDQLAENLTAPIEQLTGGLGTVGQQKGQDDESRTRGEGLGLPVVDELLNATPLGAPVAKLSETAGPVLEPVLGPVGEMATAAAAPVEQSASSFGLGSLAGSVTGLLGGGLLGGIGSKQRSSSAGCASAAWR